MAKIAPARGMYYDPQKVADLALVATPPYDVITPEEAQRYRDRYPYNIIRIILPTGEGGVDRYQKAALHMQAWEEEGILIRDTNPSLYPYQQVFTSSTGEIRQRNGFISLIKLEPLGQGSIIPHEGTSPKPVEDRLSLMEACGANLSQVFALYSDPAGTVEEHLAQIWSSSPRHEFRDDAGVIHRLWHVDDRTVIASVAKAMQDRTLLIADGHHRYKTALMYRDRMRTQYPSYTERSPFEYTMLYLTPIEGEGLLILPTHRLVSPKEPFDVDVFFTALKKYFSITTFVFNDAGSEQRAREDFFEALDTRIQDRYTFGLYIGSEKRYIQLIFNDEVNITELLKEYPEVLQELDVTLLDGFILKGLLGIDQEAVGLSKGRNEALDEVHQGRYSAAFLLNPPSIQQVKRVVDAGEVMPRKTTFFYPKVATGLVIYKIVPEEEVTVV